jgi:ABC-type branched-subunit amino acid transport system substrate-binding protein
MRNQMLLAAGLMVAIMCGPNALAQKKYGPGASDTEIKLGQTMPYSGPASAYGAIGKAEVAYFQMINEQGGINGRKINLISLDDAYSPPRAVEQVRKLVEEDQVLALFQNLGTPSNSAVHKYVNAKKVPHLFIATGATKWGDPANFPWTIGFQPSYQIEAQIYAKYILKNKPTAKIALLYQNDDYGKDYVKGLKDGLGDKVGMIVAEASYEVSDPTVDSQIVTLKSSGADTMFTIATPKFAAQSIRKVADIGWQPLHFVNNVASSVGSVLTPAGLDKSTGLITALYLKDPVDPQWEKDPGMMRWHAFMKKYMPDANVTDFNYVYGYGAAQLMVMVLKACGDDLSRENLMKQATSIKDAVLDVTLPGIKYNTGPNDYFLVQQLQLARFDGKRWTLFGDVLAR